MASQDVQHTAVIIKPDANGKAEEIVKKIVDKGFKVVEVSS